MGSGRLRLGRSSQPPIAFQALAETMSLGMTYQLAASPDGLQRRFTYVSENCQEMIGITAQAMMADHNAFFDLVIPEHRELTSRVATEAILNRKPMAVEFAIRRPDGELRWIRASSAPRPGSAGWWLWDGLQVDITERKRSELELAEHRQRLDLAVEATGLGFFDYDFRTDRSIWSPRTRELYGLSAEADLKFADWFENNIHPDDRAGMEAAYQAGLRTSDGVFSLEHRAVTPDGTVRWLLAHCRLFSDEAGPRSIVGTVLDITGRKEAEERRRLVMGEIAHRAKNGLSMILAIINQTARNAESVEGFTELLSARITAMSRSQDLVTGAGGPLVLADLFKTALEPFDAGRFGLDPRFATTRLSGDMAAAMALLIHELATNATKYGALSVAGGRVEITAEPLTEEGKATVLWREVGGPRVVAPVRTGFGSRLMQAALRPQGGSVEGRFEPAGFEARLRFPVDGDRSDTHASTLAGPPLGI